MFNKVFAGVFLSFCFVASAAAQNRFEGYNILLDAPDSQTTTACAIRYVPPTTNITVTDLDSSTPMKLAPCAGTDATVRQTGNTATLHASPTNYKWCFQGEDKRYRISFPGDKFVQAVTYDWIAAPENNSGSYDFTDFGAKGDGVTDNTIAMRSALAFIAVRNGGVLRIPDGDFVVSSPSTLPSGVTIQGASGLHSGAATNNQTQRNTSRITNNQPNSGIFLIGECTEKVSIKDLELFSTTSQNTFGVKAMGAYNSSQDFYFENVVFNSFTRGLTAVGLPQTDLQWQFDYVKLSRCRFVFNTDAGIYTNVRNSDWKIQGTLFINAQHTATQAADSMHFERVGMILIEDTFGGGFSNARGGTFLNILDSGNTTIINSQTESMTYSIQYNAVKNPGAGDYSYPFTIINSIFGDPIEFNARRTYVSLGSFYGPNSFRADEKLRVYSTGDRFCYDGWILGCQGAASKDFDRATVIFMTGQPGEGQLAGHPTFFGTDVQFGATVQMPSLTQTLLPANKPNGSMAYCSNCRRSTTPCQSGGTGAPAMVVSGQWSCL
jgi:Pectate lyase superfamily protein